MISCFKKVILKTFLFAFCLTCFAKTNTEEKKRVLFISSYNSSFPTYFQQIAGIKSVLDSMDVHIDIESLDSKRFNNEEYFQLHESVIQYKLNKGVNYSAIIVSDDNALDFVHKRHREVFNELPVIFCGINNYKQALRLNQDPLFSGIIEQVSIKETIDIMLKLFPNKEQIAVIHDNTVSGKIDYANFEEIIDSFDIDVLDISLATNLFSNFELDLQKIKPDTPVLLLAAIKDTEGNILDFDESIKLIKKNLQAPIFHLYQHGLGDGIIGGKMVNHFEQGKYAALLVADILNGKDICELKVLFESPNKYQFDYNELAKYNINKSLLPHSSIIINEPHSLFYKYRNALKYILWIFVFLILITTYLAFKNRYRKKAQGILIDKVDKYSKLNNEYLLLNKDYQTINKELKSKNEDLQQAKKELRCKLKELQEKTDLLKKSEERYRMLFNNMTESFALHEIITNENNKPVDFIYLDVNEVFLKRVGMKYDDIVGKSANELFPGVDLNWIERFAQVALTGKSDSFIDESTVLKKIYETNVFCPEKGYFGAIFKDITARINSEKKLIEEKERTNYVIEGTKAGTWDWDIENNKFTINDRWANIVGYTKDELSDLNYRKWIESLHEDDIVNVSTTLGKIFSKESIYYDVEFRQKHKNGNYVWVHSRGDIMERDENGRPLRMCGTHIDITSRKMAELKLIESEQRFKTIFDKSRTVMLLVDPQTMKIEAANNSALSYYGYSEKEILNLYLNDINKLDIDTLRNMVLLSKDERRNSFSTTHSLKSGEVRNIEAYTSPISVNNKKLIHAIIIDTTKAVENEYKLRQINKRFIGLENIIHFKAKSINDLLDFTLRQLIDYTQSETGVVYHYDEEKNLFLLNNFSKDVYLSMGYEINDPFNNLNCLSKSVKLKEAVIINDPQTNYPFLKNTDQISRNNYYKSITIPVFEDDKVVALFWLGSKTTTYSRFHAEQVMLLLETTWILVERQGYIDKGRG